MKTLTHSHTKPQLDSSKPFFSPNKDTPPPSFFSPAASPNQIQRATGDGHDLASERFSKVHELEATYDNERLVRNGNQGHYVHLVQQALIELGYDFPRFGADGIFGSETEHNIRRFQAESNAAVDGIVGPETMGILDQRMVKTEPPKTVPPAQNLCSRFLAENRSLGNSQRFVPFRNISFDGANDTTRNNPSENAALGDVSFCRIPLSECPCSCPLPNNPGAKSKGDICQVLPNASAVNLSDKNFCPDAGEYLQIIEDRKLDKSGEFWWLHVKRLDHQSMQMWIQERFVSNGSRLKISHKTAFTAPSNKDKSRTDVGVGEKITFRSTVSGNWKASAGNQAKNVPPEKTNSNTFEWYAPDRSHSNVAIRFSIGDLEKTVWINVIEPNNITTKKESEIKFPSHVVGAGMKLRFYYHPMHVSFGNIESTEISGPAEDIHGYFKENYPKSKLWHNANENFQAIDANNKDSVQDKARRVIAKKPFKKGRFKWVIPNKFKVKGKPQGKEFTKLTQQHWVMDSKGTVKIKKGDAEVKRSP